jgi:hypothetical protein
MKPKTMNAHHPTIGIWLQWFYSYKTPIPFHDNDPLHVTIPFGGGVHIHSDHFHVFLVVIFLVCSNS